MRKINLIVVHCSATPEGRDVTAADINKMHIARGFKKIGYHYVVRLDGTVETGRKENEIGAHAKGYNANSIGVCYVGGLASDGKTPKDTRTPAQKSALKKLLHTLKQRYPDARIVGHRDLSPDTNHNGKVDKWEWIKACPCFDAIPEYANI
jgi:N-acetylmuramoyl-L-alanine amidase